MKDNSNPTTPSFEADLEKLKNLVAALESQNLDLDEAIVTFEQGVALGQKLAERLSQAEARLETISKAQDGSMETGKIPASINLPQTALKEEFPDDPDLEPFHDDERTLF
jgi:exodeoxyribonuclease VII small subunit